MDQELRRDDGESLPKLRKHMRHQLPARPHVVFLRLSERENTVLRARAEAVGVSVQQFLLDAAMVPERTTAERHALYTTLLATQRAVLGAANNLNQVARGVNSSGALPGEWEATAAAVRDGLGALALALAELGGGAGP